MWVCVCARFVKCGCFGNMCTCIYCVFVLFVFCFFIVSYMYTLFLLFCLYRGADKSLARPGRKEATFPAFCGT